MSLQLDINRISVSANGISAADIQQAISNIDGELMMRLGRNALGLNAETIAGRVQIQHLSLDALTSQTRMSTSELRSMIADRLIAEIKKQLQSKQGEAP